MCFRNMFLWTIVSVYVIDVYSQKIIDIQNIETWQNTELESYIGDTVTFTQPMYLTYNNLREYRISPRRIFSPTNLYSPGSSNYYEYIRLNQGVSVYLNGVSDYHRTGERIYNLNAVVISSNTLKFLNGTWSGNKRDELLEGPNLKDIDQKGQHRLLICGMNLEYYLTDNITDDGYGPSDIEEHEQQRAKISNALAVINADIYGLAEVQQGQNALKEIAADLSVRTGRTFKYISDATGVYGSYTKVGYVYCADVVSPYGILRDNDSEVQNRKKIQGFQETATGEIFLLSMNHFKAKSGSGSGNDADQGDGQGSYNSTRVKEAQSVLSQYNTLKRLYNDNDILVIGDLNAYAMEDPITTFTNSDMIDLHRYFHGDSSYSYMYNGQAGYLDHAICNKSLLPQVTGMCAFHINSDETREMGYKYGNDKSMFRCSDHDPILVGLKLDNSATSIVNIFDKCPHVIVDDEHIVIDNCSVPTSSVYYKLLTPTGNIIMADQVAFHENFISILKPTISGTYMLVLIYEDSVFTTKILVF